MESKFAGTTPASQGSTGTGLLDGSQRNSRLCSSCLRTDRGALGGCKIRLPMDVLFYFC